MRTFEYSLHFNTPAFLGNAEQNGQWRTPPIKAQLRQWWRVAYAAERRFAVNVADMRREEGLLFGIASDGEGDSRKSQIRIRLDRWDEGQLKSWSGLEQATVHHPEAERARNWIGPHAYLGYGPLIVKSGTILKANAAIQAGESATLTLAVPEAHAPQIQRALWLMDRYGALGGRCRNGWGSYALLPSSTGGGAEGERTAPADASCLRPWRDCLQLDWPHALGQDAKGPLIWQTDPHDDWKVLMKTLAIIKIRLRTQFPFSSERPPHRQPQDRHWLSYPVTKHEVSAWHNLRLPNTLRFKVRQTADKKLVGVIFHVPCLPPAAFEPHRAAITSVWQRVHAFLDAPAQQLTRIGE